jgi:hypothetical protein
MKTKVKPFATEVELCAAFIQAVGKLREKWTAYAETAGHDILLVREGDGFQIGIQAKLKMGVDVINQAIESSQWGGHTGPDCRAVLVPETTHGFGKICDYVGLTIIVVRKPQDRYWTNAFSPSLPTETYSSDDWHEWCPSKRHELPEYVPDVAAGASAPLQLTQWKIAAMKIVITLRKRGFVTREDFKAHRLDHRRWLARESQWLVNKGGIYVQGPHSPGNFEHQHPRVWGEIMADVDKWMLKIEHTARLPLG